jgi:hypothetical protein
MADFVFNPTTKTLHKNPATEQCNLDDAKHEFAVHDPADFKAQIGEEYNLCEHCFKAGEGPLA